MTLLDPLPLHVEFLGRAGGAAAGPGAADGTVPRKTREAKVRRLKELFKQALAYDAARAESKDTPANRGWRRRCRTPRGSKLVVIQANRRSEILGRAEAGGRAEAEGGVSAIDAWKVADELEEGDVPVISGR